jgi:hypothetical protein
MTDNMQAAPVTGTAPLSTSIDQGGSPLGTGGGAPDLTEPKATEPAKVEKPETPGDTLKGELARIREEEAKDAKPSKDADVKPDDKAVKADDKAADEKAARQRNEQGKFAKAEAETPVADGDKGEPEKAATGQDGSERGRPSEGRQHVEPPARFLPKEREGWANVPNVVKSAIDRLSKEHETEVSQYRESHEEWAKLDKFQQMAKQHNSTVSDALERYTTLDGLLNSNPIEAIRQIMATRGITPEQYANHVLNNPDAHRAPSPQARPDPQVQQMGTKVQQLEATIESMRHEQAAASIIEPFRAANPRYDELQNDIAFFLQSGKIPASLSPQEKLEAAYDMAVRINPTSAVAVSQAPEAPAAKTAAPAKLDGTKSIRGAPNGQDPDEDDPDATDIRTLLRREMRKAS